MASSNVVEIQNLAAGGFRVNSNYFNKNGLNVEVIGDHLKIKSYGIIVLDSTLWSDIKYNGTAVSDATGLATIAAALVVNT